MVSLKAQGTAGRSSTAASASLVHLGRGFPGVLAVSDACRPRPTKGDTRLDKNAVVGGVTIGADDIVLGDVDGVVILEFERVSVLEEAKEFADSEVELRDAVRNGTAPPDAYEEYGLF